jgi:UrcA family protein
MNTLFKAVSFAAVACAAAVTFAGAAGSAQAGEVRIQVSDLDLATSTGKAQFDGRVAQVADRMCADYSAFRMNAACREAVREEAYDNLAQQQERIARRNDTTMASTRR